MTFTQSKTSIMAHRQCPKRLWLMVHDPDRALIDAPDPLQAAAGAEVERHARAAVDGAGTSPIIGRGLGANPAGATAKAMAKHDVIFEAAITGGGLTVYADILARDGDAWRIVEVKSGGSAKAHHIDDAAIQTWVAVQSGLAISRVEIAHLDTGWVYPGGDDRAGMVVTTDVSKKVFDLQDQVRLWVAAASETVALTGMPEIRWGRQCGAPHACGFTDYCRTLEPEAAHPSEWLPAIAKKELKALVHDDRVREMKDIPDVLLNSSQQRVKDSTIANSIYFDAAGAAADLEPLAYPALFLDFETIGQAIPVWTGRKPYQQVPFQFSLHRLPEGGALSHEEFLDLTGNDPSAAFAAALAGACDPVGPVYVYNKGFEDSVLKSLAESFPEHAPALNDIRARLVDLQPIAKNRYYSPTQKGSWSIKAVLPAIAPLNYKDLEGVQDGEMAQAAWMEAVDPSTSAERRETIRLQLLAYCKLDTYAMVEIWRVFSGKSSLQEGV